MGKIDDQGYYMLHYNTRKRPLDDVRIRRALTYAIPKKRIVKLVFEGQAVPAYSVVGAVNSVWHNPNIEIVGDDGKKARRILREAGFHWDESGRLCYPTKYTLKPFSD
jgi:ABC-type transport system substrate-binding protein